MCRLFHSDLDDWPCMNERITTTTLFPFLDGWICLSSSSCLTYAVLNKGPFYPGIPGIWMI